MYVAQVTRIALTRRALVLGFTALAAAWRCC
jgi:hypothetical protein